VKCAHAELLERTCPDDLGYVQCLNCHSYLSLGKARDTDDVLVEIRAAEIAQIAADGYLPLIADFESYGWDGVKEERTVVGCGVLADPFYRRILNRKRWLAGWFAREIWLSHAEAGGEVKDA
jgi:hypothetical protein